MLLNEVSALSPVLIHILLILYTFSRIQDMCFSSTNVFFQKAIKISTWESMAFPREVSIKVFKLEMASPSML